MTALANVTLLNTFDEWRVRTNQIIYKLDQNEGANTIFLTSNSSALIIAGTANLNANVYYTLRTSNNVNDVATSNVASANAVNAVHEVTRTAFAKANTSDTVYTYAANNVMLAANSAYAKANTTYTYAANDVMRAANAAFAAANSVYTYAANVVMLAANSAYELANSGTTVSAAYNKANSANLLAYGGHLLANTTWTYSANTVMKVANSAWDKANTANLIALGAFTSANLQPSRGSANSYEFRLGTSSTHTLTPASVWDTNAVLTDGTNIAVDLSKGFDFSGSGNAPLSLGGNRTLDFASNVKQGQKGVLWFSATSSTRTLTLSGSYKLMEGVETGPYSILANALLGLAYVCNNGNVYITSVLRRSTI